MAKNSNWSILVDVEFETKQIQQELKKVQTNFEITADTKQAQKNIEDLGLTFNVANEIFQKSVDIIGDLVGKVATLDASLVEFRKVSDLSGSSLDAYVEKLSIMGKSVARTGKPNWYEPVCTDGKCA